MFVAYMLNGSYVNQTSEARYVCTAQKLRSAESPERGEVLKSDGNLITMSQFNIPFI